MASTLVRGKYVICKVTGPSSAEVIADGAVFQRNGEIIEVGRYENLRARHPAEEVIGSPNHVVMPGLINDHYHVGLTPFQIGVPDLPLEMWGLARMGKRGARDIDPYLDNLYGASQMIETGTTTVQVIHSAGRGRKPADLEAAEKIIKAYLDAGMRVSYSGSQTDQNSLVAGPRGGEKEFLSQLPADLAERFGSLMARTYRSPEELVAIDEEICAKYAGGRYERVRVVVAPSNVHRCSDELLVAMKDLARKHNTAIHIHLLETVYQKLYGLRAWEKTPLQHLHDLGFLGPEVTCGHSVWVTEEDIDIMAATGAGVCHNASSNLRLQSGIAPVNRFLRKGIRVAMGTDEAGINDDKDMFQEMRLVLKLHREPGIDNPPPTAHQVFQMATVNGAHASGYGDRIGTLEPGKRADITVMDLGNIEEPFLDSEVPIVDAVVHRGRGIDVNTVMVDGELIMRDHRLMHVDKKSLFKELKEWMTRSPSSDELGRSETIQQVEPYLRRFYAGAMRRPRRPHYYYNARS